MRTLTLAVVALFLFTSNALAQADPSKATGDNASGQNPFGSYNYGEFDSVDLAAGGLNLSLNLAQMSARGHRSHYTLYYSSKFWSVSLAPTGAGDYLSFWNVEKNNFTLPNSGQSSSVGGAGWDDSRGRLTKKSSKAKCIVAGIQRTVTLNTNYVYRDQNGAKHNFPNWQWVSGNQYASWCGIPSTSYTTGYSTDAQGSRLQNTSVKHRSGNGEYSDTNGNVWSPYPASGTPTMIPAANGQVFAKVNTDASLKPTSVEVLDSSAVWQIYGFEYISVSPTATFQNPNSSLSGKILTALHRINLPNGTNYTFEYTAAAGELSKVILPTGGYIRYVYQTIANSSYTADNYQWPADNRYLVTRAVSPDGNPASEQIWTFTYTRINPNDPSSPLTTTVNKPDGSYEIHRFLRFDDSYRETEVEGHAAGGALLRKVVRTWTSDSNVPITSWSSDADVGDFELPQYGAGNFRVADETTIPRRQFPSQDLLPVRLAHLHRWEWLVHHGYPRKPQTHRRDGIRHWGARAGSARYQVQVPARG